MIGLVSTFAGTGSSSGFVDGAATSAKFSSPAGIALDTNGVMYVCETSNAALRIIANGKIMLW
jgi:hypothetical protein